MRIARSVLTHINRFTGNTREIDEGDAAFVSEQTFTKPSSCILQMQENHSSIQFTSSNATKCGFLVTHLNTSPVSSPKLGQYPFISPSMLVLEMI